MNLTFTKATAMFRTPAKKTASSPGSSLSLKVSEESSDAGRPRLEQAGPSVRRSFGELEADITSTRLLKTPTPPKKAPQSTPPKLRSKATIAHQNRLDGSKQPEETVENSSKEERPVRYLNRTTEAKACLQKAKIQLLSSRNLKKEIKEEITKAVERLYQLVKDAEAEKGRGAVVGENPDTLEEPKLILEQPTELMKSLVEGLQQHKQVLLECQQHTQSLSDQLQLAPRFVAGQGPSFAEVAASPKQHFQEPLHSVVVSSLNDQDTSEEVIEKLRTAVDARNEGTRVERLRKARDQKVVVGFRTKQEMTRVTERIRKAGNLVAEEVKNKDPLIIVRDVLSCHSDVEVTQALQRQNSHLIGDIPAEELRLGVKYRRRTRNPHMCHVVLQVSPTVWQRLITAGRVHIDLQRVRVQDQSPLVQCTRCLRFGHSRKLCTRPADLCIHCGEPHMRADCPSRLADEAPKCHNCLSAKLDSTEHNAFDNACPIRVKWDALARLSVAYC